MHMRKQYLPGCPSFPQIVFNFDENIVIMMSIIAQITIPDQVKDEIDNYFK